MVADLALRGPAVQSVRAAILRLDAAGPLGAVVARDDAAALMAAAALDNEDARPDAPPRPLRGVALTVKDWIDVADLPCEGEATSRSGRVPALDATAVARLRRAGAVVVAKSQPGQDHPIHGRCLHPLDADRSPGGSSTGEAVLVTTGASALGLGSDSGGSIRVPAAWCGVAGLKPSYGRVPGTGHYPEIGLHQDGRTVIGPIAPGVRQLIAALRVIAGPDGKDGACAPVPLRDPEHLDPRARKVAVVHGEGPWRPAGSTGAAVERAAGILLRRGCVVLDEPFPVHLEESLEITRDHWARASLSGARLERHLQAWDHFTRRANRAAASCDVILGPTVADVAPLRRDLTAEDYVFTLPWSLLGWPAVTVPVGTDPATGLPLAVQVAARHWDDHIALAVAGWIEADLRREGSA